MVMLIVAAVVVRCFWWLLAIAAVVVAVRYGRRVHLAWRRAEAAKAGQRAGIASRADQQHAWQLRGDPRGVYGDTWPDVREYRALVSETPDAAQRSSRSNS